MSLALHLGRAVGANVGCSSVQEMISLVFCQTAPGAEVFLLSHSLLQAFFDDRAFKADRLCLPGPVRTGLTTLPVGMEEQIWVRVAASSLHAPLPIVAVRERIHRRRITSRVRRADVAARCLPR